MFTNIMRTFILFIMLFGTCAHAQFTVIDAINNENQLDSFALLVMQSGLSDSLASEGPYTVFAPNDNFFATNPNVFDSLSNLSTTDLQTFVFEQIIGGNIRSFDLVDGQTLTSLSSAPLRVEINNGDVTINSALITMPNILTDNGIVHIVDKVFEKETTTVFDIISSSADHTFLTSLLSITGLDAYLDTTQNVTIFAPNDMAFSLLPVEILDSISSNPITFLPPILNRHILESAVDFSQILSANKLIARSGDGLSVGFLPDGIHINNAKLGQPNLQAANGFVHVIEDVIETRYTITDLIKETDSLSIFFDLIQSADLLDKYCGRDSFTIFAPSNSAFAQADTALLNMVISDTDKLIEVLSYHEVPNHLISDSLVTQQIVRTSLSKDINISSFSDSIYANNALLTDKDNLVANGVVHVVDQLLLPPRFSLLDALESNAALSISAAIARSSNLADSLISGGPYTLFTVQDSVWNKLEAGITEDLILNASKSTQLLSNYLINVSLSSMNLVNGLNSPTINGEIISFSVDQNNDIFANGVKLIVKDIQTDNGVIHIIEDITLLAPQNIYDVVIRTPELNQFEDLIRGTNIQSILENTMDITVLAPNDTAIANASDSILNFWLADDFYGNKFLGHHVLREEIFRADIRDGDTIQSFKPQALVIDSIDSDNIFFGGSRVLQTDLFGPNGVLHVMEDVIVPAFESVSNYSSNASAYSIWDSLLTESTYADSLNSQSFFTAFIPSNQAFDVVDDLYLGHIRMNNMNELNYLVGGHIVADFVNRDSLIQTSNIDFLNQTQGTVSNLADTILIQGVTLDSLSFERDNGFVHTINAVLPAERQTIWAYLQATPQYSTLVSLLSLTDLSVQLDDPDSKLSVFAPQNAYLDTLDNAFVEGLMSSPDSLLTFLTHHVLDTVIYTSFIVDGQMETSLADQSLTFNRDSVILVEDALVPWQEDIHLSNGIIYPIEGVLNPDLTYTQSLDDIAFNVYPNPAQEQISIEISLVGSQKLTCSIVDINGQLVLERTLDSGYTNLNIKDLSAGTYLIKLQSEAGVGFKKLIKE